MSALTPRGSSTRPRPNSASQRTSGSGSFMALRSVGTSLEASEGTSAIALISSRRLLISSVLALTEEPPPPPPPPLPPHPTTTRRAHNETQTRTISHLQECADYITRNHPGSRIRYETKRPRAR